MSAQMIQLSDHFTYPRLLRFVTPSILMMIFTSIYGVVDGFFVSNFAGKTPFAAINLIMPLLMMLSTVGFMFGTGGSALVSKTFGQREPERANRYFSLFVYTAAALGVLFAALGIAFIRPAARLLGAEGEMLEHAAFWANFNPEQSGADFAPTSAWRTATYPSKNALEFFDGLGQGFCPCPTGR